MVAKASNAAKSGMPNAKVKPPAQAEIDKFASREPATKRNAEKRQRPATLRKQGPEPISKIHQEDCKKGRPPKLEAKKILKRRPPCNNGAGMI